MELQNLLYDKETEIRIVTLHRPQAMNAISNELALELAAVMDDIEVDPEARAVILTGGEKVFAAGGDIALMAQADPQGAEEYATRVGQAYDKIEKLSKPVIAAISGMALGGGCELALACDFRIAAEEAVFGLPEINLGIIPGAGGTQRLTRVVGPGWAKYLIMTGKNIDAATALKIGLVTQVVPQGEPINAAKQLAALLASKAPAALKTAKVCIDYGLNVDLPSGLNFERKNMAFLFSTEDQKEGMRAFLEKRKAQFIGK
ncbi:MAG TPA: enoyl-CoA hydratase-related protein [Syntrophomonas sp.]|nr:enoyl-CoA hydratase-related protein [Syntrophomonas sp.]